MRVVLSLDGRPVTLEALKPRLADLKRRDGVVWYYPEYTGQEPPAAASAVVKRIIEQQLRCRRSPTILM